MTEVIDKKRNKLKISNKTINSISIIYNTDP